MNDETYKIIVTIGDKPIETVEISDAEILEYAIEQLRKNEQDSQDS